MDNIDKMLDNLDKEDSIDDLKTQIKESEVVLERLRLQKILQKNQDEINRLTYELSYEPDEDILDAIIQVDTGYVTNKQLKDKFPLYSLLNIKRIIKTRFQSVKEHHNSKSRGLKGVEFL